MWSNPLRTEREKRAKPGPSVRDAARVAGEQAPRLDVDYNHPGMRSEIDTWLRPFGLDAHLHAHATDVLAALPLAVLDDFMADPAFTISDYEPGPQGTTYTVPVRLIPSKTRRGPARAVVLKRTLRRRPVPFVQWVIAHELAHAHLRNAGRWPGDDPEHAADALADEWGFPKPAKMPW